MVFPFRRTCQFDFIVDDLKMAIFGLKLECSLDLRSAFAFAPLLVMVSGLDMVVEYHSILGHVQNWGVCLQ